MRHSRRSVMSEQYKLYMKKNVFNGRYFVRNIQIMLCVLLAVAVVMGAIILFGSKNDTKDVADGQKKINAIDALFGNNEADDNKTAVKNEVAEATQDSTETIEATTEAEVVAVVSEAATSEEIEEISSIIENTDGETAVEAEVKVDTDTKEEEQKSDFENKCIANVDETLNIRKEPTADSELVGCMNKGSIARVEGTEGDWTKIKSGDVEGYVLSAYILTGRVAEAFSEDYVTVQGKAVEDGINIREDRSTDANIIKVLDKDDTISVVEDSENDNNGASNEADTVAAAPANSDDVTWLTVELDDGQIGYVSAEYVDVDKLYTLAVSAEELRRQEEERLAAERAAEQERLLAEQQKAQAESGNSSSGSGGGSTSYQGATTTPVTATASGECLGTFTITAYCGCKKCSGGSNKTASGTTPTQGRTIAADTSVLPYGTQVVIGGVVYTVEDCGSGVKGNHIDIFFATHEDALAFGSKSMKVYKY